jgi:hypothetical protein
MSEFIDLTGQRYGRLTVVSLSDVRTNNRIHWNCVCDCGSMATVRSNYLRNGSATSCGCAWRESISTHGYTYTPTYTSWVKMLSRCKHDERYAGRGISVCERWKDFANFLNDMGDRPSGMSIDRIDNNGNYEPTNCRWATRKEQSNNTRRVHLVTYDGETKTVSQWAECTGIKRETLYSRLRAGIPIEKVFTKRKETRKCQTRT